MRLLNLSSGVLFILWAVCLPQVVTAATTPPSVIASNTTWDAAGSPYVITSAVTVNSGVTLTVSPGTVVKFGTSGWLFVKGTLSAIGASGSMIHFTDLRDDQVDNIDSNGNADPPAPGGWLSIYLDDGGNADFSFCTIRYGGGMYNSGNIYKFGAGNLNVTNSTVSDSSKYGISYVAGQNTVGNIAISGSIVSSNVRDGIYLPGSTGAISISSNTISSNGGNGLFIDSGNLSRIDNNIFDNNGAYGLTLMGGRLSLPGTNSASGNTLGAVRTLADYLPQLPPTLLSGNLVIDGGTLSLDHSLTAGVRYLVLNRAFSVVAAKTLTIPAGTVVKFGTGASIDVSGTLNSNGNAGSQVYFTDRRDNSTGWDDLSGSVPAPGGWSGISINSGGAANLTYSDIRYGTTNISKFGAGTLNITSSTFAKASGAGISISASSATQIHTISDSIINGNGSDGIRFSGNGGTTTLSANSITSNGGSGIFSDSGALTLQNNTVTGNGGYALNLGGGSVGTATAPVTGNTFSNNSAGVFRLMADHLQPLAAAATSGKIVIAGGTITQATTLNNGISYVIEAIFSIGTTGVLNVPAGTTLKFSQGAGIDVNGTLTAGDTSGTMVYFTDLRDDMAGNTGNANPPVPGGWSGIQVNSGITTLEHCVIRYGTDNVNSANGGSGSIIINNSFISQASGSGIQLLQNSADLTVAGNTISNNATGLSLGWNSGAIGITGNRISGNTVSGIFTTGTIANLGIRNNVITGNKIGMKTQSSTPTALTVGDLTTPGTANYIFQNTDFGILSTLELLNDPYVEVFARHNWWGSASGPYHGTNPGGTGNAVSDHVTFSPFYNGPAASLSPQGMDFGGIAVGSASPTQSIIVTNIGDLPLLIGVVATGGANPTAFTITADDCTNTSLPPAGFCTVKITFLPGAIQAYAASIDFPANATTIPTIYSMPVTGTGTTVPVSLSIDFLGSGGGTVSDGTTVCNTACSVSAMTGTQVTFTATPAEFSIFTAWGGSCSGISTTDTCSFIAPGTTGGVTATFDRYNAHSVKIEPTFFSAIMGTDGAYAAALAGSAIKTWGAPYTETLIFDQPVHILLDGGYNSDFTAQNGQMSTFQGSLTIKPHATLGSGRVDIRNIVIKP